MIYVNFIIFLGFSIYFIKKHEDIINLYPLALWTIAALASIFYSQSVIFRQFHDFTLVPFLYLAILFLLLFLCVKSEPLKTISKCKSPVLLPFMWIIAFTSYIPFAEILYHFVSSGVDFGNIADIKNEYTSGEYDSRNILTPLSSKLFAFSAYSWFISPILFFYYITVNPIKTTYNKLMIVGFIISYLNPLLLGMTVGTRGALLWALLYFLQIFLFFRKVIPSKAKKIINRSFLCAAVGIIAIFMVITISRFSSDQYSDFALTDWIYRYMGESFCNFNTECWYTKGITLGKNCFAFFSSIVGGDGQRDYLALERITGTRMNVYNTLFGDLLYDFGHIFAAIFVLCLCYISSKLRPRNGNFVLPNFFLYSVCFYILLSGFLIWPLITKAYSFWGTIIVSICIYLSQIFSTIKIK